MLTADEIRQKYLDFFTSKGHEVIPSSPLVPENDPTVLFTTAGMHPLVPYLLGQPHPLGNRLVDFQKCIRTDDLDEVGDTFHHTFFEMLGNWSLGDYFKKESISWSHEFLKDILKIDMDRLYVTCFEGDKDAPKDEESANLWKGLGIPEERIYFFGKKDNWWGPAGQTGPCGPDTEMYYDTSGVPCGPDCKPGCVCGRFCEIWNNVFMEFNKTTDGKFEKLTRPNVDTGMGLERTTAILNGFNDNYLTDLWQPSIEKLEEESKIEYNDNKKSFRIIVDHVRASSFLIADGVQPSNKERGYVLRRIIRRFAQQLINMDLDPNHVSKSVSDVFITQMSKWYPSLTTKRNEIFSTIEKEINKYLEGIKKGEPELLRILESKDINEDRNAEEVMDYYLKTFNVSPSEYKEKIQSSYGFTSLPSVASGTVAFYTSTSHGLPIERAEPIIKSKITGFVESDFLHSVSQMAQYHQKLSQTSSAGMFKGGLQDQSEVTTKYHTATHLLHAALREVLGNHVQQKGSNITAERLRFDFSHPDKLTPDQLSKIEALINQRIESDIPVEVKEMDKSEALAQGALAFFPEKYPDLTNVYSIGEFSKELCGGPHVASTGAIGRVKITREESVGSGVRRIYAVLST